MASAMVPSRWWFAAAVAMPIAGCAEIFGIDDWTPADGEAGGGGAAASAVAGGACHAATVEQIAGDCRKARCDLAAGVVSDPDPSDRPDDGLECTEDGCQGGTAVHTPRAVGAPCSGGRCDGAGACVECLAGSDCASGVCAAGACVAPSCGDHVQNGSETDVDCGGDCERRCNIGKGCLVDDDCKKGGCSGGVCDD